MADHAELRAEFQGWLDAYPLAMFPEPDLKRAAGVLKAAGMTLDSISASNMRHVAGLIAPKAIALLDEVEALRGVLEQIELQSTNHGGWFEQNPFGEYSTLGDIARAALASRPPAEEAATQEQSNDQG